MPLSGFWLGQNLAKNDKPTIADNNDPNKMPNRCVSKYSTWLASKDKDPTNKLMVKPMPHKVAMPNSIAQLSE